MTWVINPSRLRNSGVITALAFVFALSGCRHQNDWYLKSVKGDTITLYHAGKVLAARCKGEMYAGAKDLIKSECGYLTQHVGSTFADGDGFEQISRLGASIIYWRDPEHGTDRINTSYEVWEVIEEAVQ